MNRPTAIERAFELARSGYVSNMAELRRQIKNEGYDSLALAGRALGTQLTALIKQARNAPEAISSDKLNAGGDK